MTKQAAFDKFYGRLADAFAGNQSLAQAGATKLQKRLAENRVTPEYTPGAATTTLLCQLYSEFGADTQAAWEAYHDRQVQVQKQQEGQASTNDY